LFNNLGRKLLDELFVFRNWTHVHYGLPFTENAILGQIQCRISNKVSFISPILFSGLGGIILFLLIYVLYLLSLLAPRRKLIILLYGHFGLSYIRKQYAHVVILDLVDLVLYLINSMTRNLVVFLQEFGHSNLITEPLLT